MLKQIALGMVLLVSLQVGTAWADEALNKALLDVAKYGGWSKLESLISEGADVNVKNSDGSTPLHYLAGGGSKELVGLLISKGAELNAMNEYGSTALHVAAYGGNNPVVTLLISKGADVNAKNKNGETPLHLASRKDNKEIAELLIAKGADMNAKDSNGETPLHKATSRGNKEVATFLQAALQKQEEMQKEMTALLQAALQNQSGNQRETFNRVMENYKGRVMSDAIRRPFITLAAKLKPAPVVPEEARKYLVRGNALLQDAKNQGEARAAIQEYQNALLAAPWWGDAYYNLSKAQELAGDLDGTISSMQYYLLTEPQDMREAQDRLYAIEAKRDKVKGK